MKTNNVKNLKINRKVDKYLACPTKILILFDEGKFLLYLLCLIKASLLQINNKKLKEFKLIFQVEKDKHLC